MNPVGIISMAYARPFTAAHFPLFARMRAAGLDFVEMLVPEPDEVGLPELKAAIAGAGLSVALAARINPTRDPTSDDALVRKAGRAYLKRCIDVATALGARIVGGPVYGAPLVFAGRAPSPVDEKTRTARTAWAIEALAEAGAYAAAKGVVLAVEPLNRFETDMVNTAGQAVELIQKARAPGLGVMLDTFHMNMEEGDMMAAIRTAGRYLVHFQANENHRGFLGTGHIDWATVCHGLAAVKYHGPITLEPFRREDDRIGVPLAQWRPPARNEDTDIARSAATLRRFLEAAGQT
ncbi:MAG: sugar phosphate isomerase/epimerase [Alphaproteobacteria bacterium]|nr:sugar phosphate isomerase/epimerase [Alphaproteobacteria bacterium]